MAISSYIPQTGQQQGGQVVLSPVHGKKSFAQTKCKSGRPSNWIPSKRDYEIEFAFSNEFEGHELPFPAEYNSSKQTVTKPRYIGNWRLGQSLGEGSSGKVWMAYNDETARYAAIKKIQKGSDAVQNQIVEREILLMKLTNHPHVLGLLDVFESRRSYYLVLEYCDHELFKLLPLPGSLGKRLFWQLLSAIEHLHSLDIAHRDIKFENMLIIQDSYKELNLKLSDLGLAGYQPEDSLLRTSCGSPHYAAPEVIRGDAGYDGKLADIWSMGVVLFGLLCGRLPFDDENTPELLKLIQRGEYKIPHHVNLQAQDLLVRMLQVNPNNRIPLSQIFTHPFFADVSREFGVAKPREPLPSTKAFQHVLNTYGLEREVICGVQQLYHLRSYSETEQLVLKHKNKQQLYMMLHRFRHSGIEVHNAVETLPPSPVLESTPQFNRWRISSVLNTSLLNKALFSHSPKKPADSSLVEITLNSAGNTPAKSEKGGGLFKSLGSKMADVARARAASSKKVVLARSLTQESSAPRREARRMSSFATFVDSRKGSATSNGSTVGGSEYSLLTPAHSTKLVNLTRGGSAIVWDGDYSKEKPKSRYFSGGLGFTAWKQQTVGQN